MKHRFGVTPLLLLLVGASATCGGSLTGPVSPGDWGGEHIGLVVAQNGATVEYDCASGTIDQPLMAAKGRFTAVGTHTRGHGGPVREDEIPDKHPARYDGRIDGATMVLEVTLIDSGEKLGRYTLVRGRSPRVFKCL
ncbi:MAG TPA: hypothetical protein VES88_13570 [Gemmatimonadaceae bacterium]|nr:hypothetical protein [Gemmatimonadaceae bacterium]